MKFPMKFEVQVAASAGTGTPWTAQAGSLPPILSAIPPEFMGPGGGYSPEDLFALSVINCMVATFKVYVENAKASFQQVLGKAFLTVDKQGAGFAMTQIDIHLDVTGASDPVKVKAILEAAIQNCAVSNSIKSGKTFHTTVS